MTAPYVNCISGCQRTVKELTELLHSEKIIVKCRGNPGPEKRGEYLP